jgi:uncharacterized C2H2 Zn-finger protein
MSVLVSEGLSRQARVWNDGRKTYDQEVNGERYVIQPGQFVELPRRAAVALRGHFPGDRIESALRLEMLPGREAEEIKDVQMARVYACPKCDMEFEKREQYDAHYDAVHKRVRGKPAQRTADLNAGQEDDAD